MREFRKSGSVGARGEQSPRATRRSDAAGRSGSALIFVASPRQCTTLAAVRFVIRTLRASAGVITSSGERCEPAAQEMRDSITHLRLSSCSSQPREPRPDNELQGLQTDKRPMG